MLVLFGSFLREIVVEYALLKFDLVVNNASVAVDCKFVADGVI